MLFAVSTVPVETILGLLVALVLHQKFVGRGFVRGLILLPWALPYVVNGAMWKWIFNANYGALNALLLQSGLIDNYQIWLGEPKDGFPISDHSKYLEGNTRCGDSDSCGLTRNTRRIVRSGLGGWCRLVSPVFAHYIADITARHCCHYGRKDCLGPEGI